MMNIITLEIVEQQEKEKVKGIMEERLKLETFVCFKQLINRSKFGFYGF